MSVADKWGDLYLNKTSKKYYHYEGNNLLLDLRIIDLDFNNEQIDLENYSNPISVSYYNLNQQNPIKMPLNYSLNYITKEKVYQMNITFEDLIINQNYRICLSENLVEYEGSPYYVNIILLEKYKPHLSFTFPKDKIAGERITFSVLAQFDNPSINVLVTK